MEIVMGGFTHTSLRLCDSGEIAPSDTVLQSELDSARQASHPDPEILLDLLQNTSDFYLAHEEIEKGEFYLKELLSLCEPRKSSVPLVYISAKYNLALICFRLVQTLSANDLDGNPPPAQPIKEKQLELEIHIREAYEYSTLVSGPGDKHTYYCLRTYICFCIHTRQYSKADDLFSVFKGLFLQQCPEANNDYCVLLICMGSLKMIQREWTLAEGYFKEAQRLLELLHGATDSTVSLALIKLGDFYAAQGLNELADIYFTRALRIEEKEFGLDSAKLLMTLDRIKGLYYSSGMLDQAITVGERALSIRQKALDPEDYSIGSTLVFLGHAYLFSHNVEKAKAFAQKAKDQPRRKCDLEDFSISEECAGILNLYGAIYCETNMPKEAEEHYLRALEIYAHQIDDNDMRVYWTMVRLADLYRKTGEYSKAIAQYLVIKEQYELHNGCDGFLIGDVLLPLSGLYLSMGECNLADPILKQMIAFFKSSPKPDPLLTSRCHFQLGKLHKMQGDQEKAKQHFDRSAAIRKKVGLQPLYDLSKW